MKNILFIVSLLLLIGVKSFSQKIDLSDSLFTRKQSKVNLEFLGLSFQHEAPISLKNTFVFRLGFIYNFIVSQGAFTNYSYGVYPVISIGSRHYYRLYPSSKRMKKNIGNFIGFDFGAKTAPVLHKDLERDPLVFLIPYWGIQRRLGQWGSFEIGLGPAFKYLVNSNDDRRFIVSPNIQLRAGVFL